MGVRSAFKVQSRLPDRSFLAPNPPPALASSPKELKPADSPHLRGTTKFVPLRGSQGLGVPFGHFTPSTTNRSDKTRVYV